MFTWDTLNVIASASREVELLSYQVGCATTFIHQNCDTCRQRGSWDKFLSKVKLTYKYDNVIIIGDFNVNSDYENNETNWEFLFTNNSNQKSRYCQKLIFSNIEKLKQLINCLKDTYFTYSKYLPLKEENGNVFRCFLLGML